MITYSVDWDILEAQYNHYGYVGCYCSYLDMLGRYKDWYYEFFTAMQQQQPAYFRVIKFVVNRLRLVKASCRLANAAEDYMDKPQLFDLEIYMPDIRKYLRQAEDMMDAINELLDTDEVEVIMTGMAGKHGVGDYGEFSLVESTHVLDVLNMFASNRWLADILQTLSNAGVHLQEMKEYSTVIVDNVNTLMTEFPEEFPCWPRWLLDVGRDDLPWDVVNDSLQS